MMEFLNENFKYYFYHNIFMRKLQKQRKSKITRKILPFALAVGVAVLPFFSACGTFNHNHFKNKQIMSDNMENKEYLS